MRDGTGENAALELEPRLSRPGRPAGRADKSAIGEPGPGRVAAIGHEAGSLIVREPASGEGQIPDRAFLSFKVDSCARSAAHSRAAGVGELAVGKVVTPAAGKAETLAAVVPASEVADPASASAPDVTGDDRSIERLVLDEKVGNHLFGAVVSEIQAAASDLRSRIAPGSSQRQAAKVAVKLDVPDQNRRGAPFHKDHRLIGRGDQRPVIVWQRTPGGHSSLRVERTITEP